MLSNQRLAAVAVAIAASGACSAAAGVQPYTFTVDCAKGQAISTVLEWASESKPMVLIVKGTCNENVRITRDDVTLQGDPTAGGVVNGPSTSAPTIDILSQRVTIDRLTVTGGGVGVQVHGASNAAITNCTIRNTGGNGIALLAAHARINNNTIRYAGNHGLYYQGGRGLLGNNTIQYNAAAGVHLEQTSTVNAFNNTIGLNGANGVELRTNSQGQFTGNSITGNGTNASAPLRNGLDVRNSRASVLDGNNIANNASVGVQVDSAQVEIVNSSITGNGWYALGGDFAATIGIVGSTISGNNGGVTMRLNSTLRVAGSTIQGNGSYGVRIRLGTALQFESPMSYLSGSSVGLECQDAESSVVGTEWLSGTTTGCTGF